MAKVNPFDIIQTTKDIPAKVIVSLESNIPEAIEILLPSDTFLCSNTTNYHAVSELSFIPHQKEQFLTIKNLYLNNIALVNQIVGYSYIINAKDLCNSYKIIKTFDYRHLRTDSIPHIYLLAYLYLDSRIQEVNTIKYLCFIAEGKIIEETRANYQNFLLTHREAVNIIVHQIKTQIRLREQ